MNYIPSVSHLHEIVNTGKVPIETGTAVGREGDLMEDVTK